MYNYYSGIISEVTVSITTRLELYPLAELQPITANKSPAFNKQRSCVRTCRFNLKFRASRAFVESSFSV